MAAFESVRPSTNFMKMFAILALLVSTIVAEGAFSISQSETKGGGRFWDRRRQLQDCEGGDPSLQALKCLEPLHEEEYSSARLQFILIDSSQQLEILCDQLEDAQVCVFNAEMTCGRADRLTQLTVQTTLSVAGYLCTAQGKRLLLSEKTCWQNEGFDQVFDHCIEKQSVNSFDVCRELQKLRKCVKTGVRDLCGSRWAAKFVDKMLYYTFEPMARGMFYCDLTMRIPPNLDDAKRSQFGPEGMLAVRDIEEYNTFGQHSIIGSFLRSVAQKRRGF